MFISEFLAPVSYALLSLIYPASQGYQSSSALELQLIPEALLALRPSHLDWNWREHHCLSWCSCHCTQIGICHQLSWDSVSSLPMEIIRFLSFHIVWAVSILKVYIYLSIYLLPTYLLTYLSTYLFMFFSSGELWLISWVYWWHSYPIIIIKEAMDPNQTYGPLS
jgi:hypothetical protein